MRRLCHTLKVHPSGYYAWLAEPQSSRAKEDQRLLGLIADSTPFGHSAHADPDTCSTIIRTGSRSAATQGWHC
ncbi:hypothetical protein B8W70_00015 [Pseudomonas sp. 1239]|nr:hypothetical protein B8W70_00015 [Pseudomonas sp. 1239]